MFRIVLYQPEIPPNTGNIIRLCANTGCSLHLIEPLGFSITDRELRRAGLDYAADMQLKTYRTFDSFLAQTDVTRLFMFSTKHQKIYTECAFRAGDSLVFGPETRGLPESVRSLVDAANQLTLPMTESSRSLNLANAVGIAVYEACRQCEFRGL